MRPLIIALTSLALAGCANLGEAARARFGAPPPVALEAESQRQARRLDALADYLRRYDLVQASAGAPHAAFTLAAPAATPEFAAADTAATYLGAGYPTLLAAYAAGRRDQVDGLCTRYFSGLQQLAGGAQWGQAQLGVVSRLASLIMGLSGASARDMALLTGANAAVGDSFAAARSALSLSPSPEAIHRLVRARQAEVLAGPAPFARFEDAERHVRAYAHPCTPGGMRELVDEALR